VVATSWGPQGADGPVSGVCKVGGGGRLAIWCSLWARSAGVGGGGADIRPATRVDDGWSQLCWEKICWRQDPFLALPSMS